MSLNNTSDARVSVIVPVYKVEGTLETTVRSIQAQTYDNLEIILVDDGSPDKSGEICDKLAFGDSRIKVIHKQNGGVSSARNEGILNASSDFLCFVDADDEVDPTMVENLMKALISSGAQLVVAGITEYHKKIIKTFCENSCQIDFSESDAEEIIGICSKYLMPFTHSKLYIRRILMENNLRFREGLVSGEDHLLNFQYLTFVDKMTFIDESLYRYYCFNSNGTTRFFPLFGQIEIFKAKEGFVRKNCTKEAADEFCANSALQNLIARFNYLAKRKIRNYDELAEAYDVYWPYIKPYLSRKEVFSEDNEAWLSENLNYLTEKNIKAVYKISEKKFKKKSKRLRNLEDFLNMPVKKKLKFILKKLHIK
ncbi:MAG: glycosyltransferase family 2 protein [Clostridia bacterium]|nr:glycosyltransferase family 2 protein [Clostridia bacterium]